MSLVNAFASLNRMYKELRKEADFIYPSTPVQDAFLESCVQGFRRSACQQELCQDDRRRGSTLGVYHKPILGEIS